jgi:hypothetical protein
MIIGVEEDPSTSCDTHHTAYKRGKSFGECKEEAAINADSLSEEIYKLGEISWKRVLDSANYDELIYKLTLKYLRQKGFDIGNNTIPRVKQLNL